MLPTLCSSTWILLLIFVAVDSETGLLRNLKYNKCLRPAYNGKGAWVTLDDCSHTGSGQLTIDMSEILDTENLPTPTRSIRFISNWLCLTLNGNSTENGSPFITSDCLGEPHQAWTPVFEDMLAGTFHLKLKHNGRCLYVENKEIAVTQWDCFPTAAATNQIWKFEPFNEPHPHTLLESVVLENMCLQCMSSYKLCERISMQPCDTDPTTSSNLRQRVAITQPLGATTLISIADKDICLKILNPPVDGHDNIVGPGYCGTRAQGEWKLVYTQENCFQLQIENKWLESQQSLRILPINPDYSHVPGVLWKFRNFNNEDREVYMLESKMYSGECLHPNPTSFPDLEVVTCDATQGDQLINAKDLLENEFSPVVFQGSCLSTFGSFNTATRKQAKDNQKMCALLKLNCAIQLFVEDLARVVLVSCSGEPIQRWKIFNGKLGTQFQLHNEENGECLTIKETSGKRSLWVDVCFKVSLEQFWSVRTGFV